jgi:hypothetical protein
MRAAAATPDVSSVEYRSRGCHGYSDGNAWPVGFGIIRWYMSIESLIPATSGQVMLSALPILLGFQLLISALAFDIGHVPTVPLHVLLSPFPSAHPTGFSATSQKR